MIKKIYCKRCKSFIPDSKFYSNNSARNISLGRFKAKDCYCISCRLHLTRKSQLTSRFYSLTPTPFEFWSIALSSKTFEHFNDYFPDYCNSNPTAPFGIGPYLHFFSIPKYHYNYYLKAYNYKHIPEISQRLPFNLYLSNQTPYSSEELNIDDLSITLHKYRSIRHIFSPNQTCILCKQVKSTYLEAFNPLLFKALLEEAETYPKLTLTNFARSYRSKNGWSKICNSCRFSSKKELK